MPLHQGTQKGKPYYRWGETGATYFYVRGNKRSREQAKAKAMRQARAIEWAKAQKRNYYNTDIIISLNGTKNKLRLVIFYNSILIILVYLYVLKQHRLLICKL